MWIRRLVRPRSVVGRLGFSSIISFATAVLGFAAVSSPTRRSSASAPPVQVREESMIIPTSVEGPPDVNPPFDYFSVHGFRNYPYTLRHNLKDRRLPQKWRALQIENEYLKCTVLPDLGGHLYSCLDKISGAEMFYANPSIKFALIGYRGSWAALGVEFNFPVSHNWMSASPVDYAVTRGPEGSASIWVGNIDLVYGMQWRVQLTLRPGSAYLEQRTTLYNRSETRHRFYWWTNAGVQVWDDSRILYPMEFTAAHGFADIDTWPVDSAGVDLGVVGNHKYGPVSRFSYGSQEPYMSVYHPRTRTGVVHYSSPLDLPAKKIWSWGSDADGREWRTALSDNHSAYVEVQAGLFQNQETYGFLDPQETRAFTEYWIPIRDLDGVSRANPDVVLKLTRRARASRIITIEVALNVTRELPNAQVSILDGSRVVASQRASLSPRNTFQNVFANLPENAAYTVEVRSESGKRLLRHTEGRYAFIDPSKVHTGKQPSFTYGPDDKFGADDYVSLGSEQERNGDLLIALSTYRRGLTRFDESVALNRAAGRLEVALKQYEPAEQHLSKALARISSDHEVAYYLGLAFESARDDRGDRIQWTFAQQSARFHSAALMALATQESREGNREQALQLIQETVTNHPELVRAGGFEVALLRHLGRKTEAGERLAIWRLEDPTSSFLRYEAVRLGTPDPDLPAHLAADPQRILEIAVDYMRLGLYDDAVNILSQEFPSGTNVVTEPGMPAPNSYPLVAYYRGFCRYALGEDGRADFEAAASKPISYVFPNRAESLAVLRRAIEVNPNDATAHFLLGSLYLSGGMAEKALDQWEIARRIRPAIPTLLRNMGYTALRSGETTERAMDLFRDGMQYDPRNPDVFLGMEEAMAKAGRAANERARMLESFSELPTAPSALVFRLVQDLVEAGEFDEAEKQLANRFFPREEGGPDVREVYVALKLKQARFMATRGRCDLALAIVGHLADPVPNLSFTEEGLDRFVASSSSQKILQEIKSVCR